MKIQEHFSLKNYNTFGVEAQARYFAEVTTVEQLIEVLQFYKTLSKEHQQLLILGGGSNILFTKDFEGLVIAFRLKGISEMNVQDKVQVTAKAGENWHEFVQYTLSKNYGGLENLSLIPGNVGTCPIQNIGAYGTEIKDHFVSCKALNIEHLLEKEVTLNEVEELSLEMCRFGYRDSIFKTSAKGKYIILEVTFELTLKNHALKTEYGAIETELENLRITSPTIQDIAQAVINIRQSKLPNPDEIGNAGSFFKNPVISADLFENLKVKFPDMPGYPSEGGVKVPAGWLIEKDGWKGKQIGNVASHAKQALVLVNATGNATGKEIFDFSTVIIHSIKENFGIELEREVNII